MADVTIRPGKQRSWEILGAAGRLLTRYPGDRAGAERYAEWLRSEKQIDAKVGNHG